MSPVVLVVEHEPQCPPAHVGTWLTDAGCVLKICRPWAGDELPQITEYDGLLVLGGSMGADDDVLHHWLTPVKQVILDAAGAGVPTLGICLGHQLVASAMGGKVEPNPGGQQLGLFEVGWAPDATDDALFGPLADPNRPPRRGVQWNHDIVSALPDDATLLAATPEGEVQVARFAATVWGTQQHPEVDVPILSSWAAGDRDDHLERGIDQAALLATIDAARAELDDAWRPLAARFAELAGRRAR